MKRFICIFLCIMFGLTLFTSCSNNNDVEERYNISYYGVLDGEIIDIPAEAYLENVTYPDEYVKGEITQIENLKRYYNLEVDNKKYDISFEGWYTDETCTEEFSFIGKNTTGDLVLYAKLTSREIRAKFNIAYKAVINNEIAEIPENMFLPKSQYPNSYYAGDEIAISDLMKEYQPNNYSEYEFIKWYTSSNCDEEFTGIKSSTTGDIVLYAKIKYSLWTPNA